jgi:hypothetical protein
MIVAAAFITEYPKFVIDLSVSIHISYDYDEGEEKRISGCFGRISSNRLAYLDLFFTSCRTLF